MNCLRSDALLFAPLVRAVEKRLGEFNLRDLANTAWTFATADRSDALLFALDPISVLNVM